MISSLLYAYDKMHDNIFTNSTMTVDAIAKRWRLNGVLHRDNGPAIERIDGTKEWWVNGKLHREDGPAVEYPNGNKYWYQNNQLHREDGPAIECQNGNKRWYLNGIVQLQLHTKPIYQK